MDQQQYTVADLMTNASFRAWVTQEDEQAGAHWELFLAEYPEHIPAVETAKSLLSVLYIKENEPAPADFLEMQGRLDTALNSSRSISWYRWMAVAASLLLLIGAAFYVMNASDTITTGFAMNKQVQLPDGSKVLLNAHSTLHYKKYWFSEKSKEVWLEGEAFFSGHHPSLVVHAGGMDVNVLGTEFNVYNRKQQVEVMLESGTVTATGANWADGVGSYTMKPGELIHLDAMDKRIIHINPASFTVWRKGRLIFNNTPLYKIAQLLEENYGYHVQWKSTKLQMEGFTGSCPVNNIDVLLAAIRSVYNDQIKAGAAHTIIFE